MCIPGFSRGARHHDTTMTSKERVRATIEGKAVDKIPLGLYVVDCDTIERVIGRKTYVRNKIGSQIAIWEGRREEVVESYKHDTVEFYRKIDCVDLITFKEACLVPPKDYEPESPRKIGEGLWEDRRGRIYKASVISNELICVKDPTLKPFEEFSAGMFPTPDSKEIDPPDPSIFEACDYLVEQLGSERYIAGISGGVTALTLLGGDETGLMMYAAKPEVVRAANRSMVVEQNALDRSYIRPGQDGVLLEQDMAGTRGPLISPGQFRENCLPFLKDRVNHIIKSAQQVILHNCGDNRLLMDMFIEAGIQAYQSLQTNAHMDVESLQEKFGAGLIFWGGVPLESLIRGTTEEVRTHVRTAMEEGSKGRGFILGPSHSIAFGTKYDVFMAMLEEYNRLAG